MSEPAELVWISAQVTQDLKDQVKAIAERDERTASWVVRQALKNYVANFGERVPA